MIETLKSLIFLNKDSCYICREKPDNKKKFFCGDCYENLDLMDEKIFETIEFFDAIYYSAIYNRFLREIIMNFKFYGRNYLSKPLGELLLDTILKNQIVDIDLIIGVPMYRRKEARRGYNQSQLLASYVGEKLGIEVGIGNLIKVKNTRPQSRLDSLERRENLKDAFTIRNKELIIGRKILLIDDIMTTGSTMKECGRLLQESGAKKIVGLTLVAGEIV